MAAHNLFASYLMFDGIEDHYKRAALSCDYRGGASSVRRAGSALTRLSQFVQRGANCASQTLPQLNAGEQGHEPALDRIRGRSAFSRNGLASVVMSSEGSSFLPSPSTTIIDTLSTV